MSVYLGVCVWVCACDRGSGGVCVCAHVSVYLGVWGCVCVHVSVDLGVCMHVSVYLGVCVYM